MKVIKINFYYKGKKLLEGRRAEKNGVLTTTYLNPTTNRHISFSAETFKAMGLSEEEINKLRSYYISTSDKEVMEAHKEVNILLNHTPAVVMGLNDEFIKKIEINSHFSYQIIKKAEHWPTIKIFSADPEYEDIDSQLAKVAYEILEKHFHMVLEKYRDRLNEALNVASKIAKEYNIKAIIEAKAPTQKDPIISGVKIGIQKEFLTKVRNIFPDYTGEKGFKKHISIVSKDKINMMYVDIEV